MLKYMKAENADREELLLMCRHSLTGAEAFTYLTLNEDISEGRVWCGKDEGGKICSVIFDDGDYYIKAAGSEFSSFLSYREKCFMVYEKRESPESTAVDVSEGGITESFRLFCQSRELSFDNKIRYTQRRRAVNAGLARVFAVYEGDEMLSTAAVSAENADYAVISDVFTREDRRGEGLAARVIEGAAAYCIERGRRPVLVCEENMRSYYEKAGFGFYGKM